MHKIDLTGQTIGTRKVIIEAPQTANSHNTRWEIICLVCGHKGFASSSNLKVGGCYNCAMVASRLPKGVAGINELWTKYQTAATNGTRKYLWLLDRAEFIIITSSYCRYCGVAPNQKIGRGKTQSGRDWAAYTYNGIDRWDNTGNYIFTNCVPCCGECNRMKSDMSGEEFIAYLNRINQHLNGKINAT